MVRHFAKSLGWFALTAAVVWSVSGRAQDYPSAPPAKSADGAPAGKTSPKGWGGNYLIVPGHWSLGMANIQKEVGLTDEQKQNLKGVSDKYQAAQTTIQQNAAQLRELPREEQQKRAAELNEQAQALDRAARRKVETVLTPQQIETLKKIDFQLQVPAILTNPSSPDQLGLSEEQRQRMRQVFEEAQEKLQLIQRETAGLALGVLTPEQKEKLRQQIEGMAPKQE